MAAGAAREEDLPAEPLALLQSAAALAARGGGVGSAPAPPKGAADGTPKNALPAGAPAGAEIVEGVLTLAAAEPPPALPTLAPVKEEEDRPHLLPPRDSDEAAAVFSPSSAFRNFRRHGSEGIQRYPTSAFKEVCCFGLTGETYYDFDRGLDLDHPICILHFNDVYNIEPSATTGSGGISRFVNALRNYADANPLILFSGDVFNPSFISTYTKGRHMVPFLNMLKVHTACVGNHDLDFGVDHLEYLCGSSRFTWLLSNIRETADDGETRMLAGASQYRLFEWQGHKVGIIGLVEYEWISTLSQVNEEDIIYTDFVEAANTLSALLRQKECSLIIALTHMRAHNDERLARECEDIDLILGGHDHEYYGATKINNTIVCKSGTDFLEFTNLTIYPSLRPASPASATPSPRRPATPGEAQGLAHINFSSDGKLVPENRGGGSFLMPKFCGGSLLEWECVQVNPQTFPSNRHVDILVSRYITELSQQLDRALGFTDVPLETRFVKCRTEETNVGSWLADLMRYNTRSDIACLNSGTIRSDCVIPPGTLLLRHLVQMLPMPDELAVLRITGRQLREVMEVSVSAYPRTEGRFLQISGFRCKWDSRLPPGSRVQAIERQQPGGPAADRCIFVSVRDEDEFRCCVKQYLAEGKDGFDCLTGVPCLMQPEDCPNLPTMVQNSFSLAAMANGLRKPRNPATLRRVDTFKAMSQDEQRAVCGIINVDGTFRLSCKVEHRLINLATAGKTPPW